MKYKDFIISIVASIIAVLVGGVVVRYGWNNFITQISSVPTITLPTAIGIDLTVTYITGYATPHRLVKVYEDLEGATRTLVILISGIYTSAITLICMYFVTHFM